MVPGKAPVKSCFFAFLKLLETLRELFLAYTICCCHQHSSLWWLLSSCMKVIISKLKQRGVSLHPGCCSLGSGTCLNLVMTLQSPPSPHPIRFWETVTAWEFPKSFLCCNRTKLFWSSLCLHGWPKSVHRPANLYLQIYFYLWSAFFCWFVWLLVGFVCF